MKAVFFNKPLELSLEVSGESWLQGESVSGELHIKNHSTAEIELGNIGVQLISGEVKKVQSKDYGKIEQVQEQFFTSDDKIGSNGQKTLSFHFNLDTTCTISDKKSSLYLLCGNREQPENLGNLQLNVKPLKVISDFLQVFVDRFRFKIKALKSKKQFIEATLEVPSTKEFSSLQQFKLLLKEKDSNLEAKYQFKVKKLAFDNPSSLGTKEENITIEQILSPAQYQIYGKAFNQEGVSKLIDDALANIKVKSIK